MLVLIADDDATSRKMVAAVLKKSGYDTIEAADGQQAWNMLKAENGPKMAILDWIMPAMDGPELVKRVRGIETEVEPYLIMLTAKGEKSEIVEGLEAGADDYVSKPFDPRELLARVRVGKRLIEARQALAERIKELKEAVEHIKTLQGILPICSYCKRIRDDKGYWDQVEVYIGKHSGAMFSHSICPECMKEHYPEFSEEDEGEGNDKNG